jgi:hypothetical protein
MAEVDLLIEESRILRDALIHATARLQVFSRQLTKEVREMGEEDEDGSSTSDER